ncbi:MAG TPA: hypothetical protein VGG27_16125 [Magnetospirillaceae bacterium]
MLVYGALACGSVALLLLIIWAMGGLDQLTSLSHDGFVALLLAVGFTVFLAFFLMGLSFYSARRGYDDNVMDGRDLPQTDDVWARQRRRNSKDRKDQP